MCHCVSGAYLRFPEESSLKMYVNHHGIVLISFHLEYLKQFLIISEIIYLLHFSWATQVSSLHLFVVVFFLLNHYSS